MRRYRNELNSSERYAVRDLRSDHTAGCMDSGEERTERYDDSMATAAGVHHKNDERFNLAGDFTWRKITDQMKSDELMVSHGGYDNGDVNKDINCMFPIDRIHELAKEGFIKACAPVHAGFMGGGGNQEKFKHETGPAIAQMFKEEGVDAVILTAG